MRRHRSSRHGRSLAIVCSGCERPIYLPVEGVVEEIACPACGRVHPIRRGAAAAATAPLPCCLRCGLDRLYTQKDFNRKLGLWIFIVAAILSVPTWGVSLLVATIVDRILFYMLGNVTICYGCNTQHRGFAGNPDHGEFDLHVAESVERQPRTA
ncbi:MAG: hypothetical protein O7A63_06145 [Acidobacteria bacterium]|nr:hypothetical protein [Acidobacteriota bacterium]